MSPFSRAGMLALVALASLPGCADETSPSLSPPWTAERSSANPLLTTESPGMVVEHGFSNVNGPSVIRVPSWVEAPLGRYYMYFSHHRGSFIRLATADAVEGPWTVVPETVLHVDDTRTLDHIASPDVHVDDEQQVIRMYFHGVDDTTTWKQTTYLATSANGVKFEARPRALGPPYMRVFRLAGVWWAVAKVRGGPGGMLLRASSPEGPFRFGPRIIPDMRHAGVLPAGNMVHVFFSRIGDSPERILVTTFNPKRRWIESKESPVYDVIHPSENYEGGNLFTKPSEVGEATEPVRQLRDPFVFSDNGQHYLFYSIAGEAGIAVATLKSNR